MSCFWLVCLGGVASVAHAEDAFQGYRLFFTEAQRKQATLEVPEQALLRLQGAPANGLAQMRIKPATMPGAGVGKSVLPRMTRPHDTGQPHHLTAPPDGLKKEYQVYFTGLITGLRGAQLLVNDLPCQFKSAVRWEDPDRQVSIGCSGVRNDALILTLSPGTGELVVSSAGGRKYRLLPGEGL
jgi:hypothetical protein